MAGGHELQIILSFCFHIIKQLNDLNMIIVHKDSLLTSNVDGDAEAVPRKRKDCLIHEQGGEVLVFNQPKVKHKQAKLWSWIISSSLFIYVYIISIHPKDKEKQTGAKFVHFCTVDQIHM